MTSLPMLHEIMEGILLCAPAVEGFVYDEHAYRIAGIKESAGGRIVRGANQVEAGLLHLAHLADFCIVEGTGSQHAIVVVYASTIDEYFLSVEHKTVFGIERERADAVLCRCIVDGRAILLQFHLSLVERWTLWRPQLWIPDEKSRAHSLALASLHGCHQLGTAHYDGSVTVGLRLILHGHLHLHLRLVSVYLWRADKNAILGNMQRGHGL